MRVFLQCAVPGNVHTPATEGCLFYIPSPPGNSSLLSYIASKNLAFKTPLPLGISNDLPWGGYEFFLELHNGLPGVHVLYLLHVYLRLVKTVLAFAQHSFAQCQTNVMQKSNKSWMKCSNGFNTTQLF